MQSDRNDFEGNDWLLWRGFRYREIVVRVSRGHGSAPKLQKHTKNAILGTFTKCVYSTKQPNNQSVYRVQNNLITNVCMSTKQPNNQSVYMVQNNLITKVCIEYKTT